MATTETDGDLLMRVITSQRFDEADHQRLLTLAHRLKREADPSGAPKIQATLIEQQAVRALNMVKAWRDSDGNEPFPHEARELIDALLMMAEQRRIGLTSGGNGS